MNQTTSQILVVDDRDSNLDLLCGILSQANFRTITAIDGLDAIDKVHTQAPELIILDTMMPRLDGFETCKLLKENSDTCKIPIIFMSASSETEKKVKAFKLGANDYITKPFEKAELLARIQFQLQILDLRQTLEQKNNLLMQEINQQYGAEVSLLEINECLAKINNSLKTEINNRKKIEKQLHAEIIERQQAEDKVKKSLQEKNLLLKEIHHRVKNNLFIVSTLLESQEEYTRNFDIIRLLRNSQNRIISMALIHEQLHNKTSSEITDLSKINFQQYLVTLAERLVDSLLTKEINLTIDIQQAYLNIETTQPCGLIINELISNAVEHAFPNTDSGNIKIVFQKNTAKTFTLLFEDDGIGFPKDKNFYTSESLGLELVHTLVEQLEGDITMNSDRGTEIKITFKELDYKSRI